MADEFRCSVVISSGRWCYAGRYCKTAVRRRALLGEKKPSRRWRLVDTVTADDFDALMGTFKML